MVRVVVFVEDGVVRNILSNETQVEVVVLDSDCNGCDDETIVKVDGQSFAMDHIEEASELIRFAPHKVASIMSHLKPAEESK